MAYGRSKTVEFWQSPDGHAGYVAIIFEDDDGGSGYGNRPRIARWYGTREECNDIGTHDKRLRFRNASEE